MITSNIKEVIRRFKRVQREIPGAVNKSLATSNYSGGLEEIARSILEAHALSGQESNVVNAILTTLRIKRTESGFIASMGGSMASTPDGSVVAMEQDLMLDAINHFQDAVMEWVKSYKDLSPEEVDLIARLGDEEGYRRIRDRVIFAAQRKKEDWSESGNDPEGLLSVLSGSNPAEAIGMAAALREVLDQWVSYVSSTAPALAGQNIMDLFAEA